VNTIDTRFGDLKGRLTGIGALAGIGYAVRLHERLARHAPLSSTEFLLTFARDRRRIVDIPAGVSSFGRGTLVREFTPLGKMACP
jgi:hypothetical protein